MNSVYLVFSSLEVEKRLIRAKVVLLCLKRNNLQIFKNIATAKNLVFSVYVIVTFSFDKLFLFHATTGKQCFFNRSLSLP